MPSLSTNSEIASLFERVAGILESGRGRVLRSINHMAPEGMPELIGQLRDLIESARLQALRSVDAIQVRTCWEIGRHIVEVEQQGQDRATYGARLISKLAESLAAELGKCFDASNLRYMRLFYQAFPIRDTLRHELSWIHYRNLLHVKDEQARNWYMDEAASENWATRALDRQIDTLYYERLLASRDRDPVRQEAVMQMAPLQNHPHDFNCRVRHTHHSAYQISTNIPAMHLSQQTQLINR